jgi:tetratricopeptide (TPR) repeat protein
VVFEIPDSLSAIFTEVIAGHPVLVMQNLAINAFPQWHFAVVKGYDIDSESIVLNSGPFEDYIMPLSTFERTWARANFWAITVLPPESTPATAQPDSYLGSLWDYEQTVENEALVRKAYDAAVRRWPGSAVLQIASGNFELGLSNYQAAIDFYERAIKLAPRAASAYNNLAYAYLGAGDYKASLDAAEQAVALGGDRAERYVTTLDEIREKAGMVVDKSGL